MKAVRFCTQPTRQVPSLPPLDLELGEEMPGNYGEKLRSATRPRRWLPDPDASVRKTPHTRQRNQPGGSGDSIWEAEAGRLGQAAGWGHQSIADENSRD